MEDRNITLTELKYRWTKPLIDEIERLAKERDELQEQVYLLKPNRRILEYQADMFAKMEIENKRLQAEVEELTEKVFVHSSAAMENLKEVERLQSQVPRWIPVAERLPELTEQIESDDYCVNYSKDVLIWSPMNMVPRFEIARYTDDRGWTDPYFTRIKFQETVTHWMPIPKEPDLT